MVVLVVLVAADTLIPLSHAMVEVAALGVILAQAVLVVFLLPMVLLLALVVLVAVVPWGGRMVAQVWLVFEVVVVVELVHMVLELVALLVCRIKLVRHKFKGVVALLVVVVFV
jgi:hypothetical protein